VLWKLADLIFFTLIWVVSIFPSCTECVCILTLCCRLYCIRWIGIYEWRYAPSGLYRVGDSTCGLCIGQSMSRDLLCTNIMKRRRLGIRLTRDKVTTARKLATLYPCAVGNVYTSDECLNRVHLLLRSHTLRASDPRYKEPIDS
jgi:hypothetical protein